MNNDKNNQASFSEEQVAEWKKQYGKLHAISDSDDNVVAVLRTPKLVDIERANASDPTKKKHFNFNRSILQNCAVWMKPGLMEDDNTLLGIFEQLPAIINVVECKVKEL